MLTSGAQQGGARPAHGPAWTPESLLGAVEQVYPVEAAEPTGLLPSVTLRPYQKQSLSFCLAVERSDGGSGGGGSRGSSSGGGSHPDDSPPKVGGWLCDQMGSAFRAPARTPARPSVRLS